MSEIPNPETLEVVPGFSHDQLEGWIPPLATEDEIRGALEKAFDYRGDVTITLKNETQVEGYIFDRQNGRTLADSRVRVLPKNGDAKIAIPYSEIQALAFTGRDTAAGKGWEAWLRKYWEKKTAGEHNIQREPEALE
jgi:hypothetical protein